MTAGQLRRPALPLDPAATELAVDIEQLAHDLARLAAIGDRVIAIVDHYDAVPDLRDLGQLTRYLAASIHRRIFDVDPVPFVAGPPYHGQPPELRLKALAARRRHR